MSGVQPESKSFIFASNNMDLKNDIFQGPDQGMWLIWTNEKLVKGSVCKSDTAGLITSPVVLCILNLSYKIFIISSR